MVARFWQTSAAYNPAGFARICLEPQRHLPKSILTTKPGFVIAKQLVSIKFRGKPWRK
jgi:hypothetical protein